MSRAQERSTNHQEEEKMDKRSKHEVPNCDLVVFHKPDRTGSVSDKDVGPTRRRLGSDPRQKIIVKDGKLQLN